MDRERDALLGWRWRVFFEERRMPAERSARARARLAAKIVTCFFAAGVSVVFVAAGDGCVACMVFLAFIVVMDCNAVLPFTFYLLPSRRRSQHTAQSGRSVWSSYVSAGRRRHEAQRGGRVGVVMVRCSFSVLERQIGAVVFVVVRGPVRCGVGHDAPLDALRGAVAEFTNDALRGRHRRGWQPTLRAEIGVHGLEHIIQIVNKRLRLFDRARRLIVIVRLACW